MISNKIQSLLTTIGLTQEQLAIFCNTETPDLETTINKLKKLDSLIEEFILSEVNKFIAGEDHNVILIRFIAEDDFALYEPELFDTFKFCSVHKQFIARTREAIERIGGKVSITYMESNFYETWLGVNDFDDSADIRTTWARQQIRDLNY